MPEELERIGSIPEYLTWLSKFLVHGALFRGTTSTHHHEEAHCATNSITIATSLSRELKETHGEVNFLNDYYDEIELLGRSEEYFYWDQSKFNPKCMLSNLIYLQHFKEIFNRNTCLLDFSSAGLVALYFACREGVRPNEDGMVISIDGSLFSPFDLNRYRKDFSGNLAEFLKNNHKSYRYTPLQGIYDARLAVQHSEFLLGRNNFVFRNHKACVIVGGKKNSILEELDKIYKINRHTIYVKPKELIPRKPENTVMLNGAVINIEDHRYDHYRNFVRTDFGTYDNAACHLMHLVIEKDGLISLKDLRKIRHLFNFETKWLMEKIAYYTENKKQYDIIDSTLVPKLTNSLISSDREDL